MLRRHPLFALPAQRRAAAALQVRTNNNFAASTSLLAICRRTTGCSSSSISAAPNVTTGGGPAGGASARVAGSSAGGDRSFIFGGVFRLLGLTAAFAIGTATVIIITWPFLDTFGMPFVFRRALTRGTAAFDYLSEVPLSKEEQQQVDNLRRSLFPKLSHDVARSIVASGGGGDQIIAAEEPGVVVLTGPPRSRKTELVRRAALSPKNADEKQKQRKQRPVLYIQCRGYVDPATTLHGTLTYVLCNLGFLGMLCHAYIKLLNAMMDILTVNNNHSHNSFIWFAMLLGHCRSGLHKFKQWRAAQIDAAIARRRRSSSPSSAGSGENDNDVGGILETDEVDDTPLVILDGVEQLVINEAVNSKDSELAGMTQMLISYMIRAACDEKICSLIIVCDSCVLSEERFGGDKASNGGNRSGASDKNNSNDDGGSISGNLTHLHSLLLSSQQNSNSNSGSGGHSAPAHMQIAMQRAARQAQHRQVALTSSISNSDLLVAYPQLRGRAKLLFTVPTAAVKRMDELVGELWEDETPTACDLFRAQQAMQRVASRGCDAAPPLLIPALASVIRTSTSPCCLPNLPSALVEQLDVDDDAVLAALGALEAEGLVYRVAGTSLCDATTDCDGSAVFERAATRLDDAAIAVVASESLIALKGVDCATCPLVNLDVLVPVGNKNANGYSVSRILGGQSTVVVPETVLKKVRLTWADVADAVFCFPATTAEEKHRTKVAADKILAKLAKASNTSEPWPGIVDLSTGVAATSPSQIVAAALGWRSGQVLAPCVLTGAAAADVSDGS